MSVAEQRYQAVLAMIGDGATVTDMAARLGVSRQVRWVRGVTAKENEKVRRAAAEHVTGWESTRGRASSCF